MIFGKKHRNNKQNTALRSVYDKEEIYAEQRINKVSLFIISFFLIFTLLLTIVTNTNLKTPNVISNIIGLSIYFIYSLIVSVILYKKKYHPLIKYLTIFFTVSIITTIVSGYSLGVDFVHSTRTITLTAYFLAIIISGLYQNPKLSLFAGFLASFQYAILFLTALFSGFPIEFKMETFKDNILTYDILVVYILFFSCSGILMSLITRRHKILMVELRESSLKLNREVADRKRTEKEKLELLIQLNHKSKMDAIGELAGGMAHDFNNVLSVILSASELLKLPKNQLNEINLKFVDMIIQASTRASDLISKLLAFSRKSKIISTTFDMHEIMDNIVDILHRTIDKRITISLAKGAHKSKLFGDQSVIESAFINLGINASHAMPDGGVIQIKTKNILLDQKYCDNSSFEIIPGNFLQIEVKDTGCGIPKENLQKIFEPFYTTKEQGDGTGLGLSAVYGTIQDHHGIIEVHSEVGSGTTFYILFPCSEQIIEQVKEISPILTGAGTILVVDDEGMNRIIIKDILESLGYKVLLAENGLESVEIFNKKHSEIDIILMDMIMPRMNGSEAYYKMREIDENCKVIITSGYTKNESIDELIENGLAGFINKPFTISEISNALKNCSQ